MVGTSSRHVRGAPESQGRQRGQGIRLFGVSADGGILRPSQQRKQRKVNMGGDSISLLFKVFMLEILQTTLEVGAIAFFVIVAYLLTE